MIRDAGGVADVTVADRQSMVKMIKWAFNTNLIWLGVGPSVDTVVRGVESTFREPDDVSGLEGTRTNGLKLTIPVKGFLGDLEEWRTSSR